MTVDSMGLRAVAAHYGLGLLFHACYPRLPEQFAKGLHNITPVQLEEALTLLKKYFQFVSIDEFAASGCHQGLACLSFDDGYQSVFDRALPLLQALDIPVTVFINSAMLKGGVFWRDRVRMLQNLDLVEQFEAFSTLAAGKLSQSFYRRSKDPGVNSAAVDRALQQFFAIHKISFTEPAAIIDHSDWIQPKPGVSYGNHSHAHYVLSSLTEEQQFQEIDRCRRLLEGLPGITRSEIFSIPFGEDKDFTPATLEIVSQLGYRGVALSRHCLQSRPSQRAGLQVVERFMPRHGLGESIRGALENTG